MITIDQKRRPPSVRIPSMRITMSVVTMVSVVLSGVRDGRSEDLWEHAPYRIRVRLDVASLPGLRQPFEERLETYLRERSLITAGSMWQLHVEANNVPNKYLNETRSPSDDDTLIRKADKVDKLVFLRAEIGLHSILIRAREFDVITRRWGPLVVHRSQQRGHAFRLAWSALRAAISTIATFRVDPDDVTQVRLSLRSEQLKPIASDFRMLDVGDVMIPIYRRNDRSGRPLPGGIRQVPWTFLVAGPREQGRFRGTIQSGVRRPFGVRRRGRVEQFAIAVHRTFDETRLRLTAEGSGGNALPGCQVFERSAVAGLQQIGVTGHGGSVTIKANERPIRMIWIKSGARLLARVPVMPGRLQDRVIPLPDDTARLRIEGDVLALQQELTDLVARRKILIARFRARLTENDFAAASRLLAELEELPSRAEFSERLERHERNAKASESKTDAGIQKLFSDTRAAVNQFLDQRELIRLHESLDAATEESKQTPNAVDASVRVIAATRLQE